MNKIKLWWLLNVGSWVNAYITATIGHTLYLLSIFGTRAGRQQYWWARLYDEVRRRVGANDFEESNIETVLLVKLDEYNVVRCQSWAFKAGVRFTTWMINGGARRCTN